MIAKQRARSNVDKQQRREHILSAALALWEQQSFANFTMSEVASRSGLAKGTLYLYFQTKEELLLALLEVELGAWFDTLDAALGATDSWDAERGAALFAATLEAQPALTRLLPIAASILEHNISVERARAYKELLLTRVTASAALIEQRLAFLAPGDGLWLLLQIYALVVGLGQMADPAPVVRQVLDDVAMAPLRITFTPAFTRSIITLLHGLAYRSSPADGP